MESRQSGNSPSPDANLLAYEILPNVDPLYLQGLLIENTDMPESFLEPSGVVNTHPLPVADPGVVNTHPLPVADPGVVNTHPLPVADPGVVNTHPLPVADPGVVNAHPLPVADLSLMNEMVLEIPSTPDISDKSSSYVRGRRRQRGSRSTDSSRKSSSSRRDGQRRGSGSKASASIESLDSSSSSDCAALPKFVRPIGLPRRWNHLASSGRSSTPNDLNVSISSTTSSDCSNLSVFLPPQGLPKRVRPRSVSTTSSISSIARDSSVSSISSIGSSPRSNSCGESSLALNTSNESSLEESGRNVQRVKTRTNKPAVYTSTPTKSNSTSSSTDSLKARAGSYSEKDLPSLEDMCTNSGFQYYPLSFSAEQHQAPPLSPGFSILLQTTASNNWQHCNGGAAIHTTASTAIAPALHNDSHAGYSFNEPQQSSPVVQSLPTVPQGGYLNILTHPNLPPAMYGNSHFPHIFPHEQGITCADETFRGYQQPSAALSYLNRPHDLSAALTSSSGPQRPPGLSSRPSTPLDQRSLLTGHGCLSTTYNSSPGPRTPTGLSSGPETPPGLRPGRGRLDHFGSVAHLGGTNWGQPYLNQYHPSNRSNHAHWSPLRTVQCFLPQSVQPNGLPQPIQPNGLSQPIQPNGLSQPIQPNGLPQPSQPNGLSQPIQPNGLPQTIQPDGLRQPIQPNGLPQPIQPNGLPQPIQPNGLPQPIQPNGLPQPIQPNGLPQTIQPNGLPQTIQPNGLPQPIQPNGLPQPIQPNGLPQTNVFHQHTAAPSIQDPHGFHIGYNNGFLHHSPSQAPSSYPRGCEVNSFHQYNPAMFADQSSSHHQNDLCAAMLNSTQHAQATGSNSYVPCSLYNHTPTTELSPRASACALEEPQYPMRSARRQIRFSSCPNPDSSFHQPDGTPRSLDHNVETRPQSEPSFTDNSFNFDLDSFDRSVRSLSESSASIGWEADSLLQYMSTNHPLNGVSSWKNPNSTNGQADLASINTSGSQLDTSASISWEASSPQPDACTNQPLNNGDGSFRNPNSTDLHSASFNVSASQLDISVDLEPNEHNHARQADHRGIVPQPNQISTPRKAPPKKPNERHLFQKPSTSVSRKQCKQYKGAAKRDHSSATESATFSDCDSFKTCSEPEAASTLSLDPNDPGIPLLEPVQFNDHLDPQAEETILCRRFLVCCSCAAKSTEASTKRTDEVSAATQARDGQSITSRALSNIGNTGICSSSSDESIFKVPRPKNGRGSKEEATLGKGKNCGPGKGKGKARAKHATGCSDSSDALPSTSRCSNSNEALASTPSTNEIDSTSNAFFKQWLRRREQRHDISFPADFVEEVLTSVDLERHMPVIDPFNHLEEGPHGRVAQEDQTDGYLNARTSPSCAETSLSDVDTDGSKVSMGIRHLFRETSSTETATSSCDEDSVRRYYRRGVGAGIIINRLQNHPNGGTSSTATANSSSSGDDSSTNSRSSETGNSNKASSAVSYTETCVIISELSEQERQGSHTCLGCEKPVQDRYVLHVRDHGYLHSECLRCSSCHTNLSSHASCYVKDERVFCRTDYNVLSGLSCVECSLQFKKDHDWMRVAGQHRYHIACFLCKICKRQIGSNERYHLVNGIDIYCTNHYRDLVNGDNSDDQHSPKKAKRSRTAYTESQIKYLQERFTIDSKPDGNELEKIASRIGLKKHVVQVWFQNNRARLKKTANNAKGCYQDNSNPSNNGATGATTLPDNFTFEWDQSIDTSMESQGYNSPSSPPLHMLLPPQAGAAKFPTQYGMGNPLGGAGPMGAQVAGSCSTHNLIQGQSVNGENNGILSRHDQVSPHDHMNLQPSDRSPDVSGGGTAMSNTAHDSDMATREQLSSHGHLAQERLHHRRAGDDIYPEHFYGDNSSNGNTASLSLELHHQHAHQQYLEAYSMRHEPSAATNHHLGAVGLYNPNGYVGMPPISAYQPYSSAHNFAHFPSMVHSSSAHLDSDVAFSGEASANAALNHQFQGDNHNQPNGTSTNSHPISSNAAGLGSLNTARQGYN